MKVLHTPCMFWNENYHDICTIVFQCVLGLVLRSAGETRHMWSF